MIKYRIFRIYSLAGSLDLYSTDASILISICREIEQRFKNVTQNSWSTSGSVFILAQLGAGGERAISPVTHFVISCLCANGWEPYSSAAVENSTYMKNCIMYFRYKTDD